MEEEEAEVSLCGGWLPDLAGNRRRSREGREGERSEERLLRSGAEEWRREGGVRKRGAGGRWEGTEDGGGGGGGDMHLARACRRN